MKKIFAFLLIWVIIPISIGCVENNVVTATDTPFPSSLPELAETSPVSSKPVTDYPAQLLEGLHIAIAGMDYGSLFLVEVETGIHRKLEVPNETGINIYGWSRDGCTLILGTETNRVILVDIESNIKKEILRADDININGNMMPATVSLSSDENWLAFISGTGHQEYATYEFQNLIVVSIQDQKHEVYQLTESGLVHGISWKPDSSVLAYNDIDIYGVQQIFISNPDGSDKLQLTRFDKEGFIVRSVQWSPKGEKLAFIVSEKVTDTDYLAIVDTSLNNKITFIRSVETLNRYWWAPNDIIIASILASDENQNKPTDESLSWYNAVTGEKLGELDSSGLPDGNFALPGPLMFSNKIGLFSDNRFYVYDISSSQMERMFDQFTDMRYWVSAPKAFDKKSCSGKE